MGERRRGGGGGGGGGRESQRYRDTEKEREREREREREVHNEHITSDLSHVSGTFPIVPYSQCKLAVAANQGRNI